MPKFGSISESDNTNDSDNVD